MQTVFWVFGYGSLMWDPGFQPIETVKARVKGFSRAFCLRSTMYRGTVDNPGLVLGLDEDAGACCSGMAMRIAPDDHDEVMAYLRLREMSGDAYREAILKVELADGRDVEALAYVMRRDHWQYAGDLCLKEQARIIARAHGGRGPNSDYLFNTARHLNEIGLADAMLDSLAEEVRRILPAQPKVQ